MLIDFKSGTWFPSCCFFGDGFRFYKITRINEHEPSMRIFQIRLLPSAPGVASLTMYKLELRGKTRREIRGEGKRDSHNGGIGSSKKRIAHHCIIFCNRKSAKSLQPTKKGREQGLKGTRRGKSGSLVPLLPLLVH